MSHRRNSLILLFVAGLLIASGLAIASQPTRLGLDLRGGIELVYQGQPTPQQPEVTPENIEDALEILRRRVDSLGVAEPEIQRLGPDQVLIGLPDVKDTERAIEQVGKTAQLYFYDWEPNVIGRSGAEAPAEEPFTRLIDAVRIASRQKPECVGCTTGARFYLFDRRSDRHLAGPEPTRGELLREFEGRQPEGSEIVKVPRGTLVVANERAAPTGEEERRPPNSWFVIRDRPEMSGKDLRNPEQNFDPTTNQPNVTFEFSAEGREQFHEVTRRIAERGFLNQIPGQPSNAASDHFAIVLDNEIVSRPIIDFEENPDGIDGRTGAQISGSFTIQEAQDLAEFLRIGALPIELKLISQSTVSASLGQEALEQGLVAGIAGLLVVLLFLALFYRVLGLIAGAALLAYGAFFYALIELIPITLTLPGIAGLILTIGVAADSNIVIFERIKEEVRAGKAMTSAIPLGYGKGIRAVIDGNAVTFFTAFILFVLATAGVKGFAFTLGVGILISLFTAVVMTHAILMSFSRARWLRSPRVLGARETAGWRFDFMGASKWMFSASGVILLVGAISLATLGINFGIDFESGTRIRAALERPAQTADVRRALSEFGLADSKIQEVADPALGETVFQVQTAQLEPEQIGEVEAALAERFGLVADGFASESVGPTFGEQVAKSAVWAMLFSLLVISAYVAFRFEAKFAVPVLIAVAHDILITAGVYSLTGREMTSSTVAALLTIIGYSLYDTIIVFDRIRENLPRMPRAAFSQIVNRSMSEILTRSLATSFSTLLPITALFMFGGETLKDFAFALIVGVISGAYSSIFIASPVLTAWKEREGIFRRRRERIVESMGYVPTFPEQNVVAKIEEEGEFDPPEAPPEPEPVPDPDLAPARDPVFPSIVVEQPKPERKVGASKGQRRRKHGRGRR